MRNDSDAQTNAASQGGAGGILVRGAHLLALSSFAVVQPLLDVLKGDATFFVARRSQPVDLIALGMGLVLLIPLALLLIESIAGAISRNLRSLLHLLFVGALAGLVVLPPAKGMSEGTGALVAIALSAGALTSLAYARVEPVRSFLTLLSPAPLVFAGLFYLDPSVSKLLGSGSAEVHSSAPVDSDTTVVFVILDELPVTSLVDADWNIDPQLFPNFARLASRSTWFRNTTSNHHASQHAIPGILTGMMPSDPDQLPIEVDHPRNLFSLLAGSYRMNIWETFSGLWTRGSGEEGGSEPGFPQRMGSLADDLAILYGHIVLPPDMAAGLPAIDATWGEFGAGVQDEGASGSVDSGDPGDSARGTTTQPFGADSEYKTRTSVVRAFIDSIDGAPDPALHFLHILLPHTPWERLPTGQRYTVTNRWDYGRTRSEWAKDEGLVAQSFQRHILQVGHVDRLLGELIDRLEDQGLYDRSAFVLVADHGCSIRPSQPFRSRFDSPESVREVLHVPFFVKAPFQEQGIVDDRNVQAMDVFPTLADAIGVEIPWEVDGRSALDGESPELEQKTIHFLRSDEPQVVSGRMPSQWTALDEKTRLFHSAPGWAGIYALGPRPEWIGSPVESLERGDPIPAKLDLVDRYRYTSVDSKGSSLPAYVQGEITREKGAAARGGNPGLPTEIAVAVNGIIRAVTITHHRSKRRAVFSALVPPDALRDGRNGIDIFGVIDGRKLAPIRGVTYALEGDRIVDSDGRSFSIGKTSMELSRVSISERSAGLGLTGWVADFAARKTAQRILIFLDGECATSGPMNHRRPDLDSRFDGKHPQSGFNYLLSVEMPREEVAQRVRVFALVGDVASEMKFGR